MSLNKILICIFMLSLATASNAILGLSARSEQKSAIEEARASYNEGDYARTIDIMEDLLLKNAPKRRLKRAYFLIGNSYQKLGLNDKAMLKYAEAIEFYPKDVDLNLALGDIYYMGALYEQAVLIYNNVLQLEPDNRRAHLMLGKSYLATGSFGRAAEYFRKYLELGGEETADFLYHYSLSLFSKNENKAALEPALKADNLERNADIKFLLARIYKSLGDLDIALETINSAFLADKSRADIRLTQALWMADDKAHARQGLQIAQEFLENDPGSRLALLVKAMAYFRLGEEKEGVKALRVIEAQGGSGFIDKMARALLNSDIESKIFNLNL